jgi:Mrp family chromosome partitioning ATPase/capsular polysaccharide biosynthesis protein
VLVPAAALFLSLLQTKQYRASAEVYINKQSLGAALTGIQDTLGSTDDTRELATNANLARVPEVARGALALAKIDDLTPEGLLAESSVAPKGNSDILEFTVTDPDPSRAEVLATAYADAFTRYRSKLDTQALERARSDVAAKLSALERTGRGNDPLYLNLSEKEQQLATLQTLQTARAFVARGADGAVKVKPTPSRNVVLGLVLGLVLGVGLAFAVDALDTRMRSATEIGESLGLPLLARIPPPPKKLAKSDELVMVAQPRAAAAEAFRVLRTNLDFARLGVKDVRLVLVTSAVDQEGKSTTAANLAVALARAGKRVALVDLDLHRPYVDRFFRLIHSAGLTDVALGNASLDEALAAIDLATGRQYSGSVTASIRDELDRPPESGHLDVLVSGPLPPDPGEFVAATRVAEILRELRERYDLVLLDGPPLLRVGDAMTLSSRVDALLVVTRLNIVRRPMLAELRRLLEATPVPTLGYMVTGAALETGYGAGYGYEDAYHARTEKRTRSGEGVESTASGGEGADRTEEPV